MMTNQPNKTRPNPRNTGAAAVLAMMFLVIFGSLAAAMAIVSQGNLHAADSQLKVNRALSAAETGMNLIAYRLEQAALQVRTADGVIVGGPDGNAQALWDQTADLVRDQFAGQFHNLSEPFIDPTTASLHIGPIALGAGQPTFEAVLTPHPLPEEDYTSSRYDTGAYDTLLRSHAEDYHDKAYHLLTAAEIAEARAAWTPDEALVRCRVIAADGPAGNRIFRAIEMDYKIDKKIRFAILSGSRVMIGRNVIIEGDIGSRFLETHLENGHPVQMESDFYGLDPETGDEGLDAQLEALVGTLITNDTDGDNRLALENSVEVAGIDDPEALDTNADGYIDDWDFFLGRFSSSTNPDGSPRVTALDMENKGVPAVLADQLLEMIDTFGDPTREGFNDGLIDDRDRYAKIRGEVYIKADLSGWLNGAADPDDSGDGAYQDYFQGPIHPDFGDDPLTFQTDATDAFTFTPDDFDVSNFRNMATGDFESQSDPVWQESYGHQVDDEQPVRYTAPGAATREGVPFGSPYPYDFYERPVYENMTFTDVTIPKGTNALFRNCHFIGVTFIETETHNTDPEYIYAGMQEEDGSLRFPDAEATVGADEVGDTKTISNNLRFEDCTFEGAIVSDAPQQFTHTRNKIAFTGRTKFLDMRDPVATPDFSHQERQLFMRSTILAPHYSVELGTFVNPNDTDEQVNLSGTIVAGLIDMRGRVEVNGTLLTTFEPKSGESPVVGDTSPQFNTTLGYFSSAAGDLEAELPGDGLGVIQVRYDPTLPLPDGLDGPIEVRPLRASYLETGIE